jgi:hypothetical protein
MFVSATQSHLVNPQPGRIRLRSIRSWRTFRAKGRDSIFPQDPRLRPRCPHSWNAGDAARIHQPFAQKRW